MFYFYFYNLLCILYYIILKYFLFCKWGFFIYIILDILIGFDLECWVFLNENVIFSVNMSNYNICCYVFDFVDSLKINCINVFFVNY